MFRIILGSPIPKSFPTAFKDTKPSSSRIIIILKLFLVLDSRGLGCGDKQSVHYKLSWVFSFKNQFMLCISKQTTKSVSVRSDNYFLRERRRSGDEAIENPRTAFTSFFEFGFVPGSVQEPNILSIIDSPFLIRSPCSLRL